MDTVLRLRTKLSPFSSLAHKDFRLFILGFFISQLGFQSLTVAINWQMYQLTHSALALGLIGIASVVPTLLFSLVGGLVADRWNRKVLLVVTQIGFGIMALILALLSWQNMVTPAVIYILLFFQFTISAFYAPVRQSILPNIIPDHALLNAISLNTLARQSAIIIGPSIAGFILAFYGTEVVYFSSAIALLLMIVTIIPIKVPELVKRDQAPFTMASIMEGVNFMRRSSIMTSTTLLDFSANLFGAATSLLPIFAVEILKADARALGILYASTSIGGVVAGIIFSSLKRVPHQGKIILIAVFLFGVATIGYGLSRTIWLTCFFLALIGATDMVSAILRNNIRQMITPDHLRGRVVGVSFLFANAGPKLGDAEAGLVAAIASAPFSVVIGGVGSIIATIIIAVTHPRLVRYKGSETGV